MSAPAAVQGFELRCFSCSGRLEDAKRPMCLAAAFKPSRAPDIPVIVGEQRQRCRKCTWVNVFVPVDPPTLPGSWRMVETKKAG